MYILKQQFFRNHALMTPRREREREREREKKTQQGDLTESGMAGGRRG
jgi:hypothetical protein